MALDDLTLADVAEVERLAQQPLADLADPKAMKGKLMQSIVYVMKKKTEPSFSFEQAGTLTMEQMNELIGADPTPTP